MLMSEEREDSTMKLQDMMYIALFTAIVGVLSFFPPIPLPFIPVPITAQTLGVMLAGGILGARRGGLRLLVFLLLIAVGTPLLPGGRGGLSALVGPSGGHILSWPIAAWMIGYSVEQNWHTLKIWNVFLYNIIGGIVIDYLIGVTVLSIVGKMPRWRTSIAGLAYLTGCLIKAIIDAYMTVKVNQAYPLLEKLQKTSYSAL